jgi:hypothetical protein
MPNIIGQTVIGNSSKINNMIPYYNDNDSVSAWMLATIIILMSCICIIVIAITGFKQEKIRHQDEMNAFKNKAMQLGYAEYNRTNGVWQFIEKN